MKSEQDIREAKDKLINMQVQAKSEAYKEYLRTSIEALEWVLGD